MSNFKLVIAITLLVLGIARPISHAQVVDVNGDGVVGPHEAIAVSSLWKQSATGTVGSSSGSADLLDGLDSTQFLRRDVSDEFMGTKLTVNGLFDVGIGDASGFDVNFYGSQPGDRVFWNAKEGAFRAGRALGDQWAPENIGFNSIGLGINNTASGDNASAAIGFNTTASGDYSTAMGDRTTASGANSTAFGYATTASGYFSTSMGFKSSATGKSSTAMGSRSTAIGGNSTAVGLSTIASGTASTALGNMSSASGENSTAMGVGTISLGLSSTAMGEETFAGGNNSTAMGFDTFAGGFASTSMGYKTFAGGAFSNSMGYLTAAVGDYSLAAGQLSFATAENSVAMGYGTTATGNAAIAMGYDTTASGVSASALGYGTVATGVAANARGLFTTASGHVSTAMGGGITAAGQYTVAIGLGDQADTVISQDSTFAIMGGRVGINNASPTHLLDVGTMGAYCDGLTWMDGSSRDYKKDIQPLSHEDLKELVSTLDEVEMVNYLYKQEEEGTPPRVGMIAEEMPDVLASKKRKGLDTGRHIGFLMGVVKAMRAEMEDQRREIEELQALIESRFSEK